MRKLGIIIVTSVSLWLAAPAVAKPGGVVVCVWPASYLHCNAVGNCYCSLFPS